MLFANLEKKRSKPVAPVYNDWGPLTDGSVLLSIDPSIAKCGWSILLKIPDGDPIRIASGVINPRGSNDKTRFDDLATTISSLSSTPRRLNGTDFKPSDAVVEIPWGVGRGGRPMMDYARAVGICEAACSLAGLSMNRVRVTDWKGHGKKHTTLVQCRALFHYEPKDDNECDAIMLGAWLCWRT